MESLANLLPLLACPIGMGLMMWMMMRGNKDQPTGSVQTPAEDGTTGRPVAASMPERGLAALRAELSELQARQTAVAAQIGGVQTEAKPSDAGDGRVGETRSVEASERPTMSKMGGMCLNWKVIGGLAVVGLGVWAVAPNLVWAAAPLLLVAACPLSMLFMMRGRPSSQCASQPQRVSQPARAGSTPDEQLAELKGQLATTHAQQEAIAGQIARLEAASAPAVHQAEAVARAADERGRDRA